MARVDQLIAEAESITVGEADDEILLRASALLAEHRRMLADVERELRLDR
jgi:hypothetical protein